MKMPGGFSYSRLRNRSLRLQPASESRTELVVDNDNDDAISVASSCSGYDLRGGRSGWRLGRSLSDDGGDETSTSSIESSSSSSLSSTASNSSSPSKRLSFLRRGKAKTVLGQQQRNEAEDFSCKFNSKSVCLENCMLSKLHNIKRWNA